MTGKVFFTAILKFCQKIIFLAKSYHGGWSLLISALFLLFQFLLSSVWFLSSPLLYVFKKKKKRNKRKKKEKKWKNQYLKLLTFKK